MLSYLGGTWWRFLPPAQRQARVVRVEGLLRTGLVTAKTASQKASWFGALRNVFATAETTAWLRSVWEQKERHRGLAARRGRLHEPRTRPGRSRSRGWRDILTTQLARIENPDRKGRFAVRDAGAVGRSGGTRPLVPGPQGRQQPAARAMGPRRSRATCIIRCGLTRRRNTCKPSLDLLWEIQKTGDIFFPTRLDGFDAVGPHVARRSRGRCRNFLPGCRPTTHRACATSFWWPPMNCSAFHHQRHPPQGADVRRSGRPRRRRDPRATRAHGADTSPRDGTAAR